MCGIAGKAPGPSEPEEVLRRLAHRGPDARAGVVVNACGQAVWLGHTRLAVIDASDAGSQPMQSRDGRWWITYNGEIYNHKALRRALKVNFRGHSDTETLVEGLACWGLSGLLSRINGMFAFAALDMHTARLYLVRDPFGIKPLYYLSHLRGDLAFASEVGALRAMSDGARDIDLLSLQTYLTLRYVPSPRTLWSGVCRLPPGHVLCADVSTGATSSWCYARNEVESFTGTIDEAVDEYRRVLADAVDRQMISDVPVGLLLSGGIDSALVTAMCRERGHEPIAFSVGFGEGPECELQAAAETAATLGVRHVPVTVDERSLRGAFSSVVRAVEEPLGTTSVLAMWHLVKRAREEVTVVLTGQGSDEPWGGYLRYQLELLRGRIPALGKMSFLRDLATMSSAIPQALRRGLRACSTRETGRRFLETYELFTDIEREGLTGSSDDGDAATSIQYWLTHIKGTRGGDAERMMRIDCRMNLADDLLLYGDKISMAVGLETRVPMLDREVMRFVESLPLAYRARLGRSKIVHKRMARAYLPASIVNRRKRGFQIPFAEYSRGPWRQWIVEALLDTDSPYGAVLNRKSVEKLWREHVAGGIDRTRQIFALLMLSEWWRQQVSDR